MATDLIARFIQLWVKYYLEFPKKFSEFYFSLSRPILDILHLVFNVLFDIVLGVIMIVSVFYLLLLIYSYITKKQEEKSLKTKYTPFVTIQIPTYNELAAIKCAKKCLKFDYPKDKYEIIIGDDSSKKRVSEKIDGFASKHPELIKVTRRGSNIGFKPGNLNHMLKFTKGEFIVIFDSDFLPKKDFLKRIIAPFKNNDSLGVVQARWNIKNFSQNLVSILGGAVSATFHFIVMPSMVRKQGTSFLCGSAEVIRKKALEEVGGWKNGALTEDIECSFRILKKGYKIKYLEDLSCDCETPFRPKDLYKQQMRWAYGVISAFKEHLVSSLLSSKINIKSKIGVMIMLSGYSFSFLLMCLFVLGILSFMTGTPGPIQWTKLISEFSKTTFFTFGFTLTSIIALIKSNHTKYIFHLIIASLSIGMVVTYYVNVGIFKAIFNRSMNWFMIEKAGNKI
ncbi:MAG: Glycosyltransferase AglE [Candidatus Woesearchaeota archaeon]|nr:Glycosyltransferase AglE [Candidatus Woesearchaeota archaeon]